MIHEENREVSPVPSVLPPVADREAALAAAINKAYARAVAAAGELKCRMLEVGYVLVRAEQDLFSRGSINKGWNKRGESLQSWLAARCPDLPYKTAMDWKALAERSLKKIGGDTRAALALMLEGPDAADAIDAEWTPSQLAARDEIYACETKGQLRQMLMPFFGEGRHPGRPKGAVAADGELVRKLSRGEEAKFVWNRLLQEAVKRSVRDAVPLLGERETRVAYDTLGDVHALLKRHLDEFAAGGAR